MSYSIIRGPLDSPEVQSMLNALVKQNQLIKSVSLIQPISSVAYPEKSQHFKLKNYKHIPDLLQHAMASKSSFYFKAVPSKQEHYSQSLDVTDLLQYKNGTLKLTLTQASFQTTPSLATIATGVKKLPHTKVGHGSQNLVSYNHSITFDNLSHLSPKLLHVLERVFGECSVELTTFDADLSPLSLPTAVSAVSVKSVNPSISLGPLLVQSDQFTDNHDLYQLYEYLSLLHLNSDSLIQDHVDTYLSSYEVPTDLGEVHSPQLHISTVSNFHSLALLDFVNSTDYVSLSATTEVAHLLIYKNANSIICWKT